MIVLDASVWVSVLLSEDVHHQRASTWHSSWQHSDYEIAVPTLFHPEVASAVMRRTQSGSIAQRAASIALNHPSFLSVPLDLPLAILAVEVAATSALRGADAVYVALAQQIDRPLVTIDSGLADRGIQVVAVWTPEEAMENLR